MGFGHHFGTLFPWFYHNLLILFWRRFPTSLFQTFYQIFDRKWSRGGIQNRLKIYKNFMFLLPGVISQILTRFGINLAPIWCALGGLRLPFWCHFMPFAPGLASSLSNFIQPESGHEFIRFVCQCILVFRRTSSYFWTAPWYSSSYSIVLHGIDKATLYSIKALG